VKSYIPTTNVDLSYLGFPAFRIPGLESNIAMPITGFEENYFESVIDFKLYQNYPNPFNPVTTIRYSVPDVTLSTSSRAESRDEVSRVQLKIFDILGNEVATLVNEEKPTGNYEIKFNPESSNKKLASGTYFYQLQIGNFVLSKKMILLK
jgi:hypothetical protein